jgi:hypothetical protein
MRCHHGVFAVHDIPPAAYFQRDLPCSGGCECAYRSPRDQHGEVCAAGLWDEAVDEPIAYPFERGTCSFCWIPNYVVEQPNVPKAFWSGPVAGSDDRAGGHCPSIAPCARKPRQLKEGDGWCCRFSD